MIISDCAIGQIVRLVDVGGLSRVRGARYLLRELGIVKRVQAHHRRPELVIRFGALGEYCLHPKRVELVTDQGESS